MGSFYVISSFGLQSVISAFSFLATCEDYKLLQTLNNVTVSKYQEMSKKTNMLTENMALLNEKCEIVILFYLIYYITI